jgi:hypothetical protein
VPLGDLFAIFWPVLGMGIKAKMAVTDQEELFYTFY